MEGSKSMRYFEFKDDEYYALIGATTQELAIVLYTETVSDFMDEDTPIELTLEQAREKMLAVCNDETQRGSAIAALTATTTSSESCLLLSDGSLF
jgi:hypothetical protein